MSPLRNRNVTVARRTFDASVRSFRSKFGQWSAGLLGRAEGRLGNVQAIPDTAYVDDEPRLGRVVFELVAQAPDVHL